MSFKVTERQLRQLLDKFPAPEDWMRETGERTKRVCFAPLYEISFTKPAEDSVALHYIEGTIDRDWEASGNRYVWTLEFHP